MGLVYYGSYYHSPTGNWNTIANWFSFPGDYSDPDIPLGRLPTAGDTVVLYGYPNNGFGGTNSVVSTGPIGGWAGPLQMGGQTQILTGTYSGAISMTGSAGVGGTPGAVIAGGTFSGPVTATPSGGDTFLTISGGVFSGLVKLIGSGSATQSIITAGLFTGTVQVKTPVDKNFISGGTYSPTGTINVTPTSISGIINDPGFAANGGTFSPTYTIVGSGFSGGGGAGAFLSPAQVQTLQNALNALVAASVDELPANEDWILRLGRAVSATGFSNQGIFKEYMKLRPLSTLLLYAIWLGSQAGSQTPSVPKTLPLPN